jgi:GNAT superfamily N-acetyltransferase
MNRPAQQMHSPDLPRRYAPGKAGNAGVRRVFSMAEDSKIRRASPSETRRLSELALRSKAHWGYSSSFMDACREELSVTRLAVRDHRVYVCEQDGKLAGFYSLEDLSDNGIELGHLFVDPDFMGIGVGLLLVEHACQKALDLGFKKLVIQGDPNAEGFYLRCGAVRIGERESASISDRMLPLFEIQLTENKRGGA